MADTDVRHQVSEVSSKEAEIEDKHALEMNSYQDLPKVDADCNGIKDDDEVNAGGMDVPGGSYVFVSGSDVLAGDPVNKDLVQSDCESNLVPDSKVSSLCNDVTVQVGELDVDNGKIVVSPVDEHNCIVVDGADVVVTPNQDEALLSKSDLPAVEVASTVTAEEPNVTVILEPQQQQQLDCVLKVEDPIELHSNEESHIAVVDSTAYLGQGQESMIFSTGESVGTNMKSDQPNNLDSIAELGQSEKCQNVVLEAAECESSEVEVGKVKSEEPDNLDSIPELGQSEKCQNVVLEAAECDSSEVEVGKVKSEEPDNLDSFPELGQSEKCQNVVLEAAECESLEVEVGKVKSEEPDNLDSILELGQSEKCQNVVLEVAERESEVEVGKVKSEEPDNLDSIPELGQSEKCQILVPEAAVCESSEVAVGGVKSEEPTQLNSAIEVVEFPESQIITSESVESGLYQLDNEEVKSGELTQLSSAIEVVECPESQIITSESVESGLYQLDNGEVKSEEPTQLNSAIEVVECPESQIIASESVESGLYQLDNGEVKSGEPIQLNSAIEVVECPESQIITSESVESVLHQLDNGEENPEVKTNTDLVIDDSAREIKDNLDFQIITSESVESGSYQLDNGEERIEEEKRTELDIDVEGNGVSKIVVTDIILGDEASKVAVETDVPLEAGTARDIVSYENQEVSETKASECIDSSKKCPKNELPENAESLHSLANCVTSKSELGDLRAESAQCYPDGPSDDDTAIEQDGYGASLITEEIPTCGAAEDTICGTEVENLDVENSENPLSCPAYNINSEIVVKNDPVGDDEPSSSPAKYTSSETKIVFGSINPEEEVPTLWSDDVHMESEASNGQIECVGSQSPSANCLDPDRHIYESLQNGSRADVKPESEVENPSSISSRDLSANDAPAGSEILDLSAVNSESAPKSVPDIGDVKIVGDQVNGGHGGSDNKLKCQETENIGCMHIDEIPANLAGSSFVVNVESAPNTVAEIVVIENGGDRVIGGNGVTNDKLICQEMEESVGMHIAEIPACLAGSNSVESAPNSVPEIAGVENEVHQVNGVTDNKLLCQESNDDNVESHGDGIPTSLPEGSGADAIDGQNVDAEAVARPFHFLIKIPRFEDEKLREQIRRAQLQVDEKSDLREAIGTEIQVKRANCQALGDNYEVAKSEERAARRLVRLKRQEIDSALSVINKVKNAMSVEDIDSRIYNMEHMIQHETLALKEEKQFIREIKQLRHLREQLSSNMGSLDEVQQAMDQKDEIEERLKILKKELDSLKDMVSKAEAAATAARKKCDDESKKLKELQAQFRAADHIRQEAYTHMLSFKRQLFEKNKHFWMYKDFAKASKDYASRRDRVGLHRHCVKQVEKVMELWNKNDEFRREYVRCNMRSTLSKLGTLDGRSLGPDEEPPVMPSYVNGRVDRVVSNPGKANSVSLASTPQQIKQVSPAESEEAEGKSMEKVLERKNHTAKTVKPILGNGSATTVSGRDDEPKEMKEEENMQQTKEQQELAKKAEELRKEELEAKLKEQRRLEEKAKAQEALERKKRNAEKAQIRAALKAQKEAEQKEKEREKRLKKKERKKTGIAEGQDEGETGLTSEINPSEASKESEIKESATTTSKKVTPKAASYFRKQSKLKSIPPPPIRNRSGKRRMQQAIWLVVVAVLIVALFLLGSNGFFVSLKMQKRNGV